MSENNNRKKLAVGVFIFIGLLILVVGVVVIGGQHKAFVKSIRLNVVFDDVQGLQTGNNVWLSGMKVGTVKKVAFFGQSQVLVELNIEKQAQPHIRKDTKAKVGTDGLVGNKIVVLSGGSEAAGAGPARGAAEERAHSCGHASARKSRSASSSSRRCS